MVYIDRLIAVITFVTFIVFHSKGPEFPSAVTSDQATAFVSRTAVTYTHDKLKHFRKESLLFDTVVATGGVGMRDCARPASPAPKLKSRSLKAVAAETCLSREVFHTHLRT